MQTKTQFAAFILTEKMVTANILLQEQQKISQPPRNNVSAGFPFLFGDKPWSVSHSPGPGEEERLRVTETHQCGGKNRSLRAPGKPPHPAHVTEQPAPPLSPATPKQSGSAGLMGKLNVAPSLERL